MALLVSIEFTDNVVEIPDAATFNTVAGFFGVEVGQRGRKPMGKLARAILAHSDGYTIADTAYFKASDAEDTTAAKSSSSVVFTTQEDLMAALESLEFPVSIRTVKTTTAASAATEGPKSGVHEVSANTAMVKDGKVLLTSNGKTRFSPSVRKVQLTNADVRKLSDAGERGRLSDSHIVAAAASMWLPADVLDDYSNFLKNVTVTTNVPVSVDAA